MDSSQKRRVGAVILLGLAVMLTTAGCGGGGSSAPRTATLTGIVTDEYGSPVNQAAVRAGGQATLTDSNGAYTLSGVRVGRTRLWVTADGYEPFFRTFSVSSNGSLSEAKLVSLPPDSGVTFYAVQTDAGTGSVDLQGLQAGENIWAVVASRNLASAGTSYTTPTTPALALRLAVTAALPGARVKGAVPRRALGLPRVSRVGNAWRRELEHEQIRQRAWSGRRLAQPSGRLAMEYVERSVGDQSSFWLLKNSTDDPQASDWEYMPATLKYHVGSTYVFVDNRNLPTGTVGWPAMADADIQALGDAFSSSIYATTRAAFGNEDDPDLDPHIFILLSSLYNHSDGSTVGYFWSLNEGTEAEAQALGDYYGSTFHSNEKHIFFVDPENPVDDLKGVLAHEFQHMINFRQRSLVRDWDEPTWINEGLSDMSMQVNGFGLLESNSMLITHLYAYFLATATNSLTEWDEAETEYSAIADYGAAFAFMRYVYDRFSPENPDILMDIETSPVSGEAQVAAAVSSEWVFDDLFTDWTMAMALDQSNVLPLTNRRFNYGDDTLHRTYTDGTTAVKGPKGYLSMPSSFKTKRYGVDYAYLTGYNGDQTWSFRVDDPRFTDVILIRF